MKNITLFSIAFLACFSLALTGCSKKKGEEGKITIDGSSTVFPVSEAVAEEFGKGKKVKITVGKSGTGGGMKKFCAGEIDITGASRHMKDSEKELCAKNGVEYIELPVAYDGISIVVQKDSFINDLTTDELKKLWAPESEGKVRKWNEIRSSFPDQEIKLFGPGTDSGTFDYFTKKIVGKEQASRGDYTSSEDDNSLVKGVLGQKGSLAYFGFAYYAENKDKLKAVAIKHKDGEAVLPSMAAIADGTYKPLSRPIFIYVSKKAAERSEVESIVKFYLGDGLGLAKDVGYIPLTEELAASANKRFSDRVTGATK